MRRNRLIFEICLFVGHYKARFLQVPQSQQGGTAVNILKHGANISSNNEVRASIPEGCLSVTLAVAGIPPRMTRPPFSDQRQSRWFALTVVSAEIGET
jgi:hypothetical protein